MKYIIITILSLFSIHLAQAQCFNRTHNNISLNYNRNAADMKGAAPYITGNIADNNSNTNISGNVLCTIQNITLAASFNNDYTLNGDIIYSISNNTAPCKNILVTIVTLPFQTNAFITTASSPFINSVPC